MRQSLSFIAPYTLMQLQPDHGKVDVDGLVLTSVLDVPALQGRKDEQEFHTFQQFFRREKDQTVVAHFLSGHFYSHCSPHNDGGVFLEYP